ncbi:MAG: hypothetical protein ABI747_04460 [Candidatus Moraniibacteriota bacterium]
MPLCDKCGTGYAVFVIHTQVACSERLENDQKRLENKVAPPPLLSPPSAKTSSTNEPIRLQDY